MQRTKREYGFTLLEVIVVVVVISLLTGLSLAYYGNFNEEKKLEEASQKLSSTLHLARTKAVAADTDSSLSSCTDFRGYQVTIDSQTSYILQRNCQGTTVEIGKETTSNITMTTSSPTILFKPLNTGANITSTATITLKSTAIKKCIDVTISPVGVITSLTKYPC